MNILALEPYYGGSHKAFIDHWIAHSRHAWTLLTLPPYKWKWRMRHAAITLAERTAQHDRNGTWDGIFCSDMLNLAEFRGLSPHLADIPALVYFHENQLTYPVQHEDERDYQYVFTNVTTALCADVVWFNSEFHRNELLTALPPFLRRMPDYQPLGVVDTIRNKSHIRPQGITAAAQRTARRPGPIRILWAARWEHDKNPGLLFDALSRVKSSGADFRVSVIGEQFRDSPAEFETAASTLKDHIDRWGYQPSRQEYDAALAEADVIVSTADHEFFGISVVEAVAAGCYPLVPHRLAYPEILGVIEGSEGFFFDGTVGHLADSITHLANKVTEGGLWDGDVTRAAQAMRGYEWPALAPRLDDDLEQHQQRSNPCA
jgi:glycosyltransferase involved in cell wall biosynthesis